MAGRVDESNVRVWVAFGDGPPGRRNDPRWDGRLTHDADPIGFQAACGFGVGDDGEPGQVADEAFYLDVPRFSDDDDEPIIVAKGFGRVVGTANERAGGVDQPKASRVETLALAVACKVTPLLFVAYFAWKRCGRVLGATLAGLVLWLAVVPGVTFGWDRNRELMTGWYALMIERPLLKGEITTEHPNQAVTGFVYRLFTHSPSYIAYPDNIPTPAEYHNLADIGRPAAWVIVKALTAAFALAVVLLCRARVRGPTDARQGWRFAAECGLICLGMLLFSERTWKHHAVVLLLPLAALTYAVAVVELPRRVRGFAFGVLVASFVLTAGPGLLAGRAADLAMVYGTHTIAFVLQAVAVGLLLACRSGRVGGPCGPDPAANPR